MTTQMAVTSSTSNAEWPSWLPFATPALKKDSCEIDSSLQCKRISILALAAIALGAISLCVQKVYPFAALLLLGGAYFLPLLGYLFDCKTTGEAANVRAVDEYINMKFPSKEATDRIQNNLDAAKLLIKRNGNIYKFNEKGNDLFDYLKYLDFAVFKCLVDSDSNTTADKNRTSLFKRIIESGRMDLLEYFLTQKKVKPTDFTPNEQVDLWLSLCSAKAGELLARHGFSVNIRNNRGNTPLLELAKKTAYVSYYSKYDGLSLAALVTTLLSCGADKSLKTTGRNPETAWEIATDREFRKILEQN